MSDVPAPTSTARARRMALVSGALGFLAVIALIAALTSLGGESSPPPAPVPAASPTAPVQFVAPRRPGGPAVLIAPDRRVMGDGARPLLRLSPARPAEQQ